ncbi:MAG: 16S rRNA (adenine(1518)-N(6)/adenine(1519)-N(6))-dimethyltransferase RsmA [Chitinophagales bacterium]
MAKHANIKLDKSLGQHFLTDQGILNRIFEVVQEHIPDGENIIEVGPGAGALTKYLAKRENYSLIEFDARWAKHLAEKYPNLAANIYNVDFLNLDLTSLHNSMHVVGNFPYNISTQIMFKVLDYKENVPSVIGMFQKEVAQRICSKHGSKAYGIISVLIQAYYHAEYLFDVPRESFNPPPKVISGVLKLTRKDNLSLNCNPKFLKQIVKMAFNQRRKTLRNSLKQLISNDAVKELDVFNKRPEALSVDAFINLTNILDTYR